MSLNIDDITKFIDNVSDEMRQQLLSRIFIKYIDKESNETRRHIMERILEYASDATITALTEALLESYTKQPGVLVYKIKCVNDEVKFEFINKHFDEITLEQLESLIKK